MASLPAEGAACLSLRHGVRCMAEPGVSVEDVLLAAGEQIGYDNICSASRMNKAVVIFVKEENLVNRLISTGVEVSGAYINVSPLVTPTTRVTVSNVPPFIKNAEIERALASYGKLASPIKMISLGCKNEALKHVLSFRRQVFMFLNEPELNVSFRLWHEGKSFLLYASTGSMKCFECGDIGHKKVACPHKVQANENTEQHAVDRDRDISSNVVEEQPRVMNEMHDSDVTGSGSGNIRSNDRPTVSIIQNNEAEEIVGNDDEVIAEASGVGVEIMIGEKEIEQQFENSQGLDMSNDNGFMDDDACSDISDIGSQVMGDLYTLQEINDFLDETFGKVIEVEDFFPDMDKFIASVVLLQKTVSLDELSKQKRFRLRKHITKLRKGKSRTCKKVKK